MSQHLFEHHFRYDHVTGKLFWKRPTARRVKAGDEVGGLAPNCYRQCVFNGKSWKVHRIIWEMYYGVPPKGWLDHNNGIRDDNRISNLREAEPNENSWNRQTRFDSSTGVKGLSVNKGKCYRAGVCNKVKYFPLSEEGKRLAVEWLEAQRLAHGEFANHGEHKA